MVRNGGFQPESCEAPRPASNPMSESGGGCFLLLLVRALAETAIQASSLTDTSWECLTTATLLSCSQIPEPGQSDVKNVYCFNLLTLGIVCYTVIDK